MICVRTFIWITSFRLLHARSAAPFARQLTGLDARPHLHPGYPPRPCTRPCRAPLPIRHGESRLDASLDLHVHHLRFLLRFRPPLPICRNQPCLHACSHVHRKHPPIGFTARPLRWSVPSLPHLPTLPGYRPHGPPAFTRVLTFMSLHRLSLSQQGVLPREVGHRVRQPQEFPSPDRCYRVTCPSSTQGSRQCRSGRGPDPFHRH